jgi:hypothetical protein
MRKCFLILWVKRKEMVKKSRNKLMMKKKEGTFASHQKVSVFGKVWNVSLWMMAASFFLDTHELNCFIIFLISAKSL